MTYLRIWTGIGSKRCDLRHNCLSRRTSRDSHTNRRIFVTLQNIADHLHTGRLNRRLRHKILFVLDSLFRPSRPNSQLCCRNVGIRKCKRRSAIRIWNVELIINCCMDPYFEHCHWSLLQPGCGQSFSSSPLAQSPEIIWELGTMFCSQRLIESLATYQTRHISTLVLCSARRHNGTHSLHRRFDHFD